MFLSCHVVAHVGWDEETESEKEQAEDGFVLRKFTYYLSLASRRHKIRRVLEWNHTNTYNVK